jgi:hypothetical protein
LAPDTRAARRDLRQTAASLFATLAEWLLRRRKTALHLPSGTRTSNKTVTFLYPETYDKKNRL